MKDYICVEVRDDRGHGLLFVPPEVAEDLGLKDDQLLDRTAYEDASAAVAYYHNTRADYYVGRN